MLDSMYQSAFFIVPSRILKLPELQFSHLKIYETIFQFWNHDKPCYLTNSVIMERTGISSESTLRDAFIYFEKHNELIRRKIKGKRHFIQPERIIEVKDQPVDKLENYSIKNVHTVAVSTVDRRCSDAPTVAVATHNNKKINKKNIKREHARKKRVPLPDNFHPNDEGMQMATVTANRMRFESLKLIEKFKHVMRSTGKLSADWDSEFQVFCMNEKPMYNKRAVNESIAPKLRDFTQERIEREMAKESRNHGQNAHRMG